MNPKKSTAEISISTSSKAEELSKLRMYLMRGLYLITFIGLGYQIWANIIFPEKVWDTTTGVALSCWAAYATLSGLGIRYPLKMLPLLLFQFFYKSIWILGIYLPMRSAGLADAQAESFLGVCITAIILDLIIIPWPYVLKNYVIGLFKFK